MDAKTSQTTSWDIVLSPPWAQRKRWILKGFNSLPHMQWIRPKVKGWGGLTWSTMLKGKHLKVDESMG
jgi:hypothetical protein